MSAPAIIVMAKSPHAGRVKTRLSPPLSLIDAARIAEASLKDTLKAVGAASSDRVVLALEGPAGRWLPTSIEVIPQRGEDFGHRLSAAFEDVAGPALLIGMDTPQVSPALLRSALLSLETSHTDAVLGLSKDGGWWALGLHHHHPGIFSNVPMSSSRTGASQLQQLGALRLTVSMLPTLRDIDHWADVVAVAHEIPDSNLERTVRELAPRGRAAV
jgi:uncharacterized protein